MPDNRLLFLYGESSYVFPTEPIVFGTLAVQEAFNHISKFAGAVIFSYLSGSSSISHDEVSGNPHCRLSKPDCLQVKCIASCKHNVAGMRFCLRSKAKSDSPEFLRMLVNSSMKHILKGADHRNHMSSPVLALAAALVPPLEVNALPEITKGKMNRVMDPRTCAVEGRESANLFFEEIGSPRTAVEPKTRIEFPRVLHNVTTDVTNSHCPSEVLVGTGYRSMRIVMFKSIQVYAFGLYVHTDSLCEKLGSKYANVSIDELGDRQDFLQDLVREDIDMSVRLVVNCRGMRINAVRDALEKPLRARLLKMNPDTDYHCLRTFRSCFPRNTSLPMGTIIDVRRTMDGQLITRIGGKYIGAVPSKDLCMAFFDIYIGDAPVSMQARGEICKNVGSILRKCS